MALKHVLAFACVTVAAFASFSAHAEYPDRPITLVVGFPAGGGTDVQSRLLAPVLKKYLNTPVVIENRPGASGLIGATFLANGKPDGYTIGALNFPSSYAPIYQGNARYSADSFTPLANQIGGNLALTVHKSSPIKSVSEFVELAKKQPLVVGLTGVGHPSQMTALLFQNASGIKLNFVPFDGGGPARIAMLGNHLTYGFMNESEIFRDHRSGELRVLATSGKNRSALLPDVPTLKELGYDVEFSLLAGFGAPAGLPAEIEQKLVDAFDKALNDPEYIKSAKEREFIVEPMSQIQFEEALKRGNADLKKLWETNPWSK
jgi:tripartite-type tricarboxylate transporter receptor subunit TctC